MKDTTVWNELETLRKSRDSKKDQLERAKGRLESAEENRKKLRDELKEKGIKGSKALQHEADCASEALQGHVAALQELVEKTENVTRVAE